MRTWDGHISMDDGDDLAECYDDLDEHHTLYAVNKSIVCLDVVEIDNNKGIVIDECQILLGPGCSIIIDNIYGRPGYTFYFCDLTFYRHLDDTYRLRAEGGIATTLESFLSELEQRADPNANT